MDKFDVFVFVCGFIAGVASLMINAAVCLFFNKEKEHSEIMEDMKTEKD